LPIPFELQDFQDLVQLLREHPDWRGELRALLLTQELLTLPALVRYLAGVIARLPEGQQRLNGRQDQFAEMMGHNVSVQKPIRPQAWKAHEAAGCTSE
jgi:hypothetical protein